MYKKLIKIWDHMTNNIESITAGLPGIHIYVIIWSANRNLLQPIIRLNYI